MVAVVGRTAADVVSAVVGATIVLLWWAVPLRLRRRATKDD
jgi:hypothetical protein